MRNNLSPSWPSLGQAKLLAAFLASVASLFFISHVGLLNLTTYWNLDEYSHAYIIPFLAALISWNRLTEARPMPLPSWAGTGVLLGSFALSVFAALTSFEALHNYSFLIGLAGLSLAFFGKKVTAALAPALLYLFFAAPLPHAVYGNLSITMQLISTKLGVIFLQLVNIPVFQEGNVIDLGTMKLQVVEACNGLRYLFPLMSFGFLCGILLKDRMWKRGIIFFSTIPITIILNSLRIAIIGVTVDKWGMQMAEGFIHIFEGYVVFVFCLILLFLIIWGLLRIGKGGRFRFDYLGVAHGPLLQTSPSLKKPALVGTALCLSCALFFYAGPFKNTMEIVPPAPHLNAFSLSMGPWRGTTEVLPRSNIEVLKLNDYWLANYTANDEKAEVNLYIAYYEKQGVRSTIHIPLNCIIGSGWEIAEQSGKELNVAEMTLPIRRLLIKKDTQTTLVYFWLDQRGRAMSNHLLVKWYLFVDAMLMHRSDGSLVRLTTPVTAGEDIEDADNRLQRFLETTLPTIRGALPGKTLQAN